MPVFVLLALCLALFIEMPCLARQFPEVYDDAAVARLRANCEHILSMPQEQLLAMVPAACSGIYFTDCPHCRAGTQDRGKFKWDPAMPTQITCTGCGEVYPGNTKYPDDQVLEVEAPDNRVHRIPYYERPADGYRFYFRAHADYWAREYLQDRARDLAEIYFATGDEACARRAALILNRFAEVYPGWASKFDYPHEQKIFAPWHVKRIDSPRVGVYRTSRWSWWGIMDVSRPVLQAYDALYEWPGWDSVGGDAARQRIENDLIAGMVDCILREDDWRRSIHQPRVEKFIAGRVLRRPDIAHAALRRFERVIHEQFLHDGHYMLTSPSYGAQMLGTLTTWDRYARGYSDSPGYVDAVDGRRFDDLNLSRDLPGYDLARPALEGPRFPNGQLLPVNDTWAVHSVGGKFSPRTSMQPLLMPGLGAAILGTGEGDAQIHAYLNFTSGSGHKHFDALSIGLFAHGHELLPDIGYTHTSLRAWASSTMSHNTVVVDGVNSSHDPDHRGNRLRMFAVTDDFQVASAESVTAYRQSTRYRRTIALVRDTYLIDVFEVVGGNQHDYLLHGSADVDSTATIQGLTMSPTDQSLINPGVSFTPAATESQAMPAGTTFGYVQVHHAGTPSNPAVITTTLQGDSRALRTWLDAGEGAVIHLGDSPSVRRGAESEALVHQFKRPTICVRRRGENLASVFVAVHEPAMGEAPSREFSVRRQDDTLIVGIDNDVFMLALDDDPRCSFNGTRVETIRGAVRAVARDKSADARGYVDVDASLPRGAYGSLIVRFADDSARAFNVTSLDGHEGGTRLHVKEDPALEIQHDKVTLTSFPQREIAGAVARFELTHILPR